MQYLFIFLLQGWSIKIITKTSTILRSVVNGKQQFIQVIVQKGKKKLKTKWVPVGSENKHPTFIQMDSAIRISAKKLYDQTKKKTPKKKPTMKAAR